MEVKKVLKTKNGTVKFEGELSESEHDFVLSVGLNTLLEAGALPFHTMDIDDAASLDTNSEYNEH